MKHSLSVTLKAGTLFHLCVPRQSCSTLCDPHGLYVACQAPLSMEFSRQEYWIGLPFPSSGDLPTQRSNSHLLRLLHWQADSLSLHHLFHPLYLVYFLQNPVRWVIWLLLFREGHLTSQSWISFGTSEAASNLSHWLLSPGCKWLHHSFVNLSTHS